MRGWLGYGRQRTEFRHWKSAMVWRTETFERVRVRYPLHREGLVRLLCLRGKERLIVITDRETFDAAWRDWAARGYRVTILRVQS